LLDARTAEAAAASSMCILSAEYQPVEQSSTTQPLSITDFKTIRTRGQIFFINCKDNFYQYSCTVTLSTGRWEGHMTCENPLWQSPVIAAAIRKQIFNKWQGTVL